MSANKRNHLRIVVALRVMAECPLGQARGSTKNLSVGGIYMLTETRFPAGTEVRVTLEHKMWSVEVSATVTHQRPDGLGLKFINPAPDIIGDLTGIIDDILSTGVDIDGGDSMLDGNEHLVVIRRGVLEFVGTLVSVAPGEVTIEADEMPSDGEALVVLLPARSEGTHVREIIGAVAVVNGIDAPRFTASLKEPNDDFVSAAQRIRA